MPDKDSPFWPFMQEVLRVSSILLFGALIYDQFEQNKDLLFVLLAALTSGGITTAARAAYKHATKEEAKHDAKEDSKKD